jgi:hypothetical protein
MMERDKRIVADLERFRVLTRDDIVDLHFGGMKYPVADANKVLLRLVQQKRVAVSKERRMYHYFPLPSIKRDSTKIPHYLAIAGFYRELRKHAEPKQFIVEPKLGGKGLPEPDAFAIWMGRAIYIEIQRSVYSVKQWRDKYNRYEAYHLSDLWKRGNISRFPMVWIIGKTNLPDEGRPPFMFSDTVPEMLVRFGK